MRFYFSQLLCLSFSDSPASEAGLSAGDKILKFGSADRTNHRELQAIREIVMRNINQTIEVIVERQVISNSTTDVTTVNVQLIPHQWHGNGVLGCHIVPIQ